MRKVNGRRGEAYLTKQDNYIKSLHVKIKILKTAQHIGLRKMKVNDVITSLSTETLGMKLYEALGAMLQKNCSMAANMQHYSNTLSVHFDIAHPPLTHSAQLIPLHKIFILGHLEGKDN